MPLTPGTRLGRFEILSPLGQGGMGQVYRARDTHLHRDVAIKIANEEFSGRFRREAQAISALNHHNICTLYDVGPNYLVMEVVEGSPLRGPRPEPEAVRLATQIAAALWHAHLRGVIHRDLKPANILVTKSGVKVLDFGLAKLNATPDGLDATQTQMAITEEGALVGTLRYMAPEQLKGSEADQRSDVFAFGAVLYEMLAGRPAFQGDTRAELIASVLTAEPSPVTDSQRNISPALERLIRTCLRKDPDDRRQTMRDVLLDREWIAASGSQPSLSHTGAACRGARDRMLWLIAAVTSVAALLAFALFYSRQTPLPHFPVRFEQPVPPLVSDDSDMPAVSPDGRSFAYTGGKVGSKSMLWLRPMNAVEATALPGTEDAGQAFWSPDGRSIAYLAAGKLKKIDLKSGVSQLICSAPKLTGGTWNRNGVILFGTVDGPMYQVSAAGGEPQPLRALDASRREVRQAWPHFLPDGHHFIYTSVAGELGRGAIYLGSLDSKETRLLVESATNANWVSPGLLLFGRGEALMAQHFDAKKHEVSGSPFPVADLVAKADIIENCFFSSSPNGTLVYRPVFSVYSQAQPTWYDRTGKRLASVGGPRGYRQFTLSPDEKHIAAQVSDSRDGTSDVWLLDLASGIASRLTSDPSLKDTVVWSPDGREVLFSSNRGGVMSLYRKAVGSGEDHLVYAAGEAVFPGQWLQDGSFLFLNTGGRSLFRLAAGERAVPETLLKSEYRLDEPRVSPDGKWITYDTDESGQWEVYLASFPAFAHRRQVSNGGGVQGYWRKDGKELFYLSLDGDLMSVPIKPGSPPEPGIPERRFHTGVPVAPWWDQFAAADDGQRFLLLERVDNGSQPFTVVVDWPAAVNK